MNILMTVHYQPRLQRTAYRSARIVRLIIATVILSISGLSIAQAAANSVIWKKDEQIIQLVAQDAKSVLHNEHPVNADAAEIAAMLKLLRLGHKDEEPTVATVAVFTPDEIDDLSTAVATGLSRAKPSQDITFYVIGSHRIASGAFARRNRVSAGRIFYLDGKLNVIFGQLQTPLRKKNVYGRTDEDFYPRNYGSRTKATDHDDAVLITNSAIQPYRSENGVRDDWVVVQTVGSVASAPATPPKPVETISAGSIESASQQPDAATIQPAAVPSSADVENRLRELKRLRDKQLISEEAYQAKMQEILRDL